MADLMTFPDTWEEFEQDYGFTDGEQVYTNGSRLIQSFRVKQWLDHISDETKAETDTISRQAAIKIIKNYCENGCDIAEDNWCPSCQREQFIKLLETLPSAQHCMTATSNTMMSETVKIPVMDGTTERLPTSDVMDDLIKRQDAITAYCEHECGIKGMTRENCGATDCGTIFDDIPSAQPERKKGRWLPDNRPGGGFWVCSECKFPSEAFAANVLYKLCPNCGAKMQKGGE